jgi:alpha-L-rhamnosidase
MLLGIHSVAPGFSKIRLTPALGDLQKVAGSIPHPAGIIAVTYKKRNNSLYANIALPQGITATLEWKGQHIEINGSQTVIITE